VIAVVLSRAFAKPTAEKGCGLGPPPGTAAFADSNARRNAEVEQVGFQTVCEADLARYDITSELSSLSSATANLAFKPVDLAGTPFMEFASIGAMEESVSNITSRLYRSFRMKDRHIVTLFEHDMSADGSQSTRAPKDEPERINGLPARLVVMQASTGKAVSFLSWREGRRYYELWIDANVVLEKTRPRLFMLAASLPKSIPARPHEPDLIPITLGPDGMPIMPEPSATIQMPIDR
jgi:hypothetical protein